MTPTILNRMQQQLDSLTRRVEVLENNTSSRNKQELVRGLRGPPGKDGAPGRDGIDGKDVTSSTDIANIYSTLDELKQKLSKPAVTDDLTLTDLTPQDPAVASIVDPTIEAGLDDSSDSLNTSADVSPVLTVPDIQTQIEPVIDPNLGTGMDDFSSFLNTTPIESPADSTTVVPDDSQPETHETKRDFVSEDQASPPEDSNTLDGAQKSANSDLASPDSSSPKEFEPNERLPASSESASFDDPDSSTPEVSGPSADTEQPASSKASEGSDNFLPEESDANVEGKPVSSKDFTHQQSAFDEFQPANFESRSSDEPPAAQESGPSYEINHPAGFTSSTPEESGTHVVNEQPTSSLPVSSESSDGFAPAESGPCDNIETPASSEPSSFDGSKTAPDVSDPSSESEQPMSSAGPESSEPESLAPEESSPPEETEQLANSQPASSDGPESSVPDESDPSDRTEPASLEAVGSEGSNMLRLTPKEELMSSEADSQPGSTEPQIDVSSQAWSSSDSEQTSSDSPSYNSDPEESTPGPSKTGSDFEFEDSVQPANTEPASSAATFSSKPQLAESIPSSSDLVQYIFGGSSKIEELAPSSWMQLSESPNSSEPGVVSQTEMSSSEAADGYETLLSEPTTSDPASSGFDTPDEPASSEPVGSGDPDRTRPTVSLPTPGNSLSNFQSSPESLEPTPASEPTSQLFSKSYKAEPEIDERDKYFLSEQPASYEPSFPYIDDHNVEDNKETADPYGQPSGGSYSSEPNLEDFSPSELMSTYWNALEESSGPELGGEFNLFADNPFSSPTIYKDALLKEPTFEKASSVVGSIPEVDVVASEIAKRGLKRQRTVKEIAVQAIEENLTEPISQDHMGALERFVETIVLNVAAERHEDLDDILQHPDIQTAIKYVIQEIAQ